MEETTSTEQNEQEEKQQAKDLEAQVVDVLKSIFDPEIPVNIYDLGLIYEIRVNNKSVFVRMTLTAPNCPVADVLPQQVEAAIGMLPDVDESTVILTFDPPFSPDMMSEEARLELGFM